MDQNNNQELNNHHHDHHSCSTCGGYCCGGHWGRFSLTRVLLGLLGALLIFLFGFCLGRLAGFGGDQFGARKGNMMYFQQRAPMMGGNAYWGPGGMMVPNPMMPFATSTPKK